MNHICDYYNIINNSKPEVHEQTTMVFIVILNPVIEFFNIGLLQPANDPFFKLTASLSRYDFHSADLFGNCVINQIAQRPFDIPVFIVDIVQIKSDFTHNYSALHQKVRPYFVNMISVSQLKKAFTVFSLVIVFSCGGEQPPAAETKKEQIPVQKQYDRYWNDAARYLAGLPLENPADSRLADLMETPDARKQAEFFQKKWDTIEKARLQPMRDWAATEVDPNVKEIKTMFYPFGGPDFLHAATFFPGAETYIQFGLEPPGTPPDVLKLNEKERNNVLYLTRTALFSVLEWSFFRTNDMRRDLVQSQMGTGPVIMAFAARTGHQILEVKSVHINTAGELTDGAAPTESEIPGISILIRKPGYQTDKRILYFSLDISNEPKISNEPFFTFIKNQGPLMTYAKAASYLMHKDYFSRIRNTVLEQSSFFMQDDSGMPVRFLDKEKWNLKFFGSFYAPISLFANSGQPDLAKIYRDKKDVYPLPFGIGYQYKKGESNLMTAVKK